MATAPIPQAGALRAVLTGDDRAALRLVEALPDDRRIALVEDAASLRWWADPAMRCPRCLLVVPITLGEPFHNLRDTDEADRPCHLPCSEAIKDETGAWPFAVAEVVSVPAPAIVAARQMIPLVLGTGSQQADALLAFMRRDLLTMLCLIHDLSIREQTELADAAAWLAELAGGLHVCGPCGMPTRVGSDTILHEPLEGRPQSCASLAQHRVAPRYVTASTATVPIPPGTVRAGPGRSESCRGVTPW